MSPQIQDVAPAIPAITAPLCLLAIEGLHAGLPTSIALLTDAREFRTTEPVLPVFAVPSQVNLLVADAKLRGVRPFAIEELPIFGAILAGQVARGLQFVATYHQNQELRWTRWDAAELLKRLRLSADAAVTCGGSPGKTYSGRNAILRMGG